MALQTPQTNIHSLQKSGTELKVWEDVRKPEKQPREKGLSYGEVEITVCLVNCKKAANIYTKLYIKNVHAK